ncbi:hypothetical protein NX059_009435 [Plenodomus lindquistii]|nr:hypothetical protein NX059_009435 [Plenodomus lindquistii]
MAPSRILDSHIHLWPGTATTSNHHGWMTAGHFLAKRHGIQDYLDVTKPQPWGFVYVETDRYLPLPSPKIQKDEREEVQKAKLASWAEQPLEELKFLRRIVEGRTEVDDGSPIDGTGEMMMKGCVVWAPFHLHPSLFQTYLSLAEEVAGPQLWKRVVGFRYLLQGKPQGEVKRLVESQDWIENLVSLGNGRDGKGWAFDVGVDTHRDGLEPLEAVSQMIQEVRRREKDSESGKAVRFVLNHLCKPPLPSPPSPPYTTALTPLTTDKNTFMKLSGAFNEFSPSTPSDISSLLSALHPYLSFIHQAFPSRVMFGSDWPVCNVGGPVGAGANWRLWREVASLIVGWKWCGGFEKMGWVGGMYHCSTYARAPLLSLPLNCCYCYCYC